MQRLWSMTAWLLPPSPEQLLRQGRTLASDTVSPYAKRRSSFPLKKLDSVRPCVLMSSQLASGLEQSRSVQHTTGVALCNGAGDAAVVTSSLKDERFLGVLFVTET